MIYEKLLSTVVTLDRVNYRERNIMSGNVAREHALARWRRKPLTPPTVVDKQG